MGQIRKIIKWELEMFNTIGSNVQAFAKRLWSYYKTFSTIFLYIIYLGVRQLVHTITQYYYGCHKHALKNQIILYEKIAYRRKMVENIRADVVDFMGLKPRVIDMEILHDLRWTLYTIDERQACFVKLPRSYRRYVATESSFWYMTQYEEAREFALLDFDTFISLAHQIDRTHKNAHQIVYISNTPRAGTTLLSRLLQTEGVVSWSEPDAFTAASVFLDTGVWENDERTREIVSAMLSAYTKNAHAGDTFFIKVQSNANALVPLIIQRRPDVKHMFHYRRALTRSIASCVAMCSSACLDPDLLNLSLWVWNAVRSIRNNKFEMSAVEQANVRNLSEYAAALYLAPIERFLKQIELYKAHNIKVMVTTFEEIMERPEILIESIYDEFGVYYDDLSENLEWLHIDSQAGTVLSQERLKKFRDRVMTDASASTSHAMQIARRLCVNEVIYDDHIELHSIGLPNALN